MKILKSIATAAIVLIVFIEETASEEKCTRVKFDKHYFNIEILKEGVNNIRKLSTNPYTNIIYFIYDLLANESAAAFIKDNNEIGVIDGMKNPRTVAVEKTHNTVYFGGDTGIYELTNENVPEQTYIDEPVIDLLHYNSKLYFITRKREAYFYRNGQVGRVQELGNLTLDSFVIDNTNHVFFLDKKQLFRVKLETLAVNIHEKYVVNSLSTDIFGKVYICADDAIYSYDKEKYNLYKVSNLAKVKSLTFDSQNNPILAINDKIIKLKYSSVPCNESVKNDLYSIFL